MTAFSIMGPVGDLEAIITNPSVDSVANTVAVICHPHPLYDGSMNNKVVTTVAKAYEKLGFVTLRFNFRGVGNSSGEYAHAVGEADDLKAIIQWVKDQYHNPRLWLAGFSFGAYIAAKVASQISVDHLLCIAPPVNHFDFQSLAPLTCPFVIVQGDKDDVVPPQEVYAWVKQLTPAPQLIRMSTAGHFFHGHLLELREKLEQACHKIFI